MIQGDDKRGVRQNGIIWCLKAVLIMTKLFKC